MLLKVINFHEIDVVELGVFKVGHSGVNNHLSFGR